MNTDRFHGRVAVITGAARGQGRSHALRLAAEGADVIALDICHDIDSVAYDLATRDDLAETARLVRERGRRVATAEVDVRDADALATAVSRAVDELGAEPDVVLANAGIGIMRPDDPRRAFQDQLDVNLTGVWNTVQLSIQHLIDGGGGSIILVSSAAGLKGLPFFHPYTAAKSALVGLMKSLSYELAEHHIRVNTLHPTGVRTLMNSPASFERLGGLLQQHPRLGGMFTNAIDVEMIEPEESSNAVVFLASDESRYVTGLEFTIDAGNTIR